MRVAWVVISLTFLHFCRNTDKLRYFFWEMNVLVTLVSGTRSVFYYISAQYFINKETSKPSKGGNGGRKKASETLEDVFPLSEEELKEF